MTGREYFSDASLYHYILLIRRTSGMRYWAVYDLRGYA